MAGIGFELRKVITKGGLTNVLNAALSGIMIVAGPWLLTILTIFLVRMIFDLIHLTGIGLFQATIVYSYAFSLSLFSAVHYLFTRLIADLLWENRQREASAWLIYFAAGTAVAAAVIATIPFLMFPVGELQNPLLFKTGAVFLFVAVNLLWLLMLHISLLRWYVQILLVYVLGMASSIGLMLWWSQLWGVGGAIWGFAAGHLLIVAALTVMSFVAYSPVKPKQRRAVLKNYLGKYVLLILSGLFFYVGQWADKFFFWMSRGKSVEQSFFRLFDAYDLPVYLAGLSIIPGLVYFVIFSETSFYFSLTKFLKSLLTEPYLKIQQMKYTFIRVMHREIRDLVVFQGLFSGLAVLLAFWSIPDQAQRDTTVVTIIGAFFQLMLMTLLNFSYYFELYRHAFWGALVFFVCNAVIFPILYLVFPWLLIGAGFLISAAVAAGFSYLLISVSVRTIDRRIFLKSTLG